MESFGFNKQQEESPLLVISQLVDELDIKNGGTISKEEYFRLLRDSIHSGVPQEITENELNHVLKTKGIHLEKVELAQEKGKKKPKVLRTSKIKFSTTPTPKVDFKMKAANDENEPPELIKEGNIWRLVDRDN